MASVEAARAAARAAKAKRQEAEALEESISRAVAEAGCPPTFAAGLTRAWPLSSIVRPESDGRRYFGFELRNGLRAVVAQDPDASSAAAAALVVQAGSVHEPKDIPGLAHFCEHMVLHGTMSAYNYTDKSFPEFLKQHGGSHNGVTTMLQTCFAFDVPAEHLEGALRRFARFFTAPYFHPGSAQQEIQAIESEHNTHLQNDFRRQWATLLLDANPRHPYHWGSGCRRTLENKVLAKGYNLHRALQDFHATHYKAESMTLAVVGTQNVADLAALALCCFSGVPARGAGALGQPLASVGDKVGGREPPFTLEDFRGQVFVAPAKEVRQLRLEWLLPWQVAQWRTKPAVHVAQLLGYEGRGGMQSALKGQGLATACSAACHDYHGVASTLQVCVDLRQGRTDHASIAEAGEVVFAFLGLLRSAGPQERLFKEQQLLQALDFRFQYDTSTYSLVQDLASNLHHYPLDQALAGDQLIYEFDPAACQEVVAALQVARARLWLVAREYEGECDAVEPWYGGRFRKLRAIEDRLCDPWRAVEAGGWVAAASRHNLCLPGLNRFVPRDLGLRAGPEPDGGQPQQLRFRQRWLRAWFRPGAVNGQPKAAASIIFRCPAAAAGAAEAALTNAYCRCVQESLNDECAHQARAAGVMYKLEHVDCGFIIQFLGFNDRLPAMAAAVAGKMAEYNEVPEAAWTVVHDEQERDLKNTLTGGQPYSQALAAMDELLIFPRWPRHELMEAVQRMRREDLTGWGRRLTEECLVEALVVGNASEEDARALLDATLGPLGVNAGGAGPAAAPAPPAMLRPPENAPATIELENANAADVNGCAMQLICGIPAHVPENEGMAAVLAAVVKPMFFDELRTQQQLGYLVSSFVRARAECLSLVFLVQAERPPGAAGQSIQTFLEEFWRHIEKMPERTFRDHRDGVLRQFEEAPRNVWDVLLRDWAPIEDGTLAFGARDQVLEALRASTAGSLRRFVREVVRPAPQLCVLVSGGAQAAGDAAPGAAPPPGAGGSVRGLAALRRLRGRLVAQAACAEWPGVTDGAWDGRDAPEDVEAPTSGMCPGSSEGTGADLGGGTGDVGGEDARKPEADDEECKVQ